jgi:hypothetical protein
MKIFTRTVSLLSFAFLFTMICGTGRAQFNVNTSVNLQISGLNDADHHSAATTDGKMWIAFFRQNGSTYNMMAQLLDAAGTRLLGPDGIVVSSQPTGSAIYVFSVCVDASNNLIIACQDQRSGSNQAVAYKIDQNGNHLWGSAGIILGGGLSPYPGVLSNGETVIAWNESTSSTLKMQKIKTNGVPAWATPVSVLIGTTKTTRGQVIPTLNGTFTLLIQRKGTGVSSTLWAQRYDTAGTALAVSAVQLSTLTASSSRYYSVLADGDTTYVGYFVASGSRFNSYLQRVNPDVTIPWGINGSNFNTSVGSTDYYQMWTTINKAPGSSYIWSFSNFTNSAQSQYGIYVQKFNKTTGARQFTDLAKNLVPVSTSRDQHFGVPIMVGDAPIYMQYEDVTYKIFASRLDADGNFVWTGNRIELSSSTASAGTPKMRYEFCPDGPNRCVGIWTENRGSGYLGYAQDISRLGVIGVLVATQGGVTPTIEIGGTLQLLATVYPANAIQTVTWKIRPVTGNATIDQTGLVTSQGIGTIWAIATTDQDMTVMDSLLITITPPSKTLTMTMFLEGLYAGEGVMVKAQDENGDHFGGNIADEVTLELHNTSDYANIVYTKTLVDLTTSGVIQATGIPGNYNGFYYLTVKHRNGIETTTADSVDFSGLTISYSFDAPSKAFGNNMTVSLDGTALIYTGDENQDGIVDGGDLSDIGNLAALASGGYIPQDINGDGLVDGSDLSVAGNNAANAVGVSLP